MTHPAPKQDETEWLAEVRLSDIEVVRRERDAHRAENAELAEKVETLTGLCGEVEQWLRLKVAKSPNPFDFAAPEREAAESQARHTIRQHFGPWLKRFRALKGKR
jgi:hypothetical protein